MLYREELLNFQRRHENISLGVAVFAAFIAAVGVGIGAYFNMKSAQIQADAQKESTRMQIEAAKELNRSAPPINGTIQIPKKKS